MTKINSINTGAIKKQNNNQISFQSQGFSALGAALKPLDWFIKSQENLSSTRFIQDTATNWLPKAVFTRSKADFADMTFLELLESGLFYFAPGLLGQFVLRNSYKNFFPKNLKKELNEHLPKAADEILSDANLLKTGANKRLLPVKAAIVLGCVCIPAAEYALSFAKNLFTLKVFNQCDFNNIANLNKRKVEDKKHQEQVEKSAKAHLKKAAAVSVASLATGILFAAVGHKYKFIQSLSKVILQPGVAISKGLEKIGIKSEKTSKFLKNYVNFDFDSDKGKLALSKGQLGATAVSGFFGYYAAAEDRGKLDKLEVLTRVPLVVFYTIFGSSAFDWAFKHILSKKNIFPDLIKKSADNSINVPKRLELLPLAEKIAKEKNVGVQKEFNRLLKEKAIITAVPYTFSLIFMGFLLSGITRFWTQYRYNQLKKENPALDENIYQKLVRYQQWNSFKGFEKK